MVNYAAGIFFDPREPPPPGFWEPVRPRADPAPAPLPPHRHANAAQPPPGRSVLPPLSISLTAQVVHDTAKVSVIQTFLNDTNNIIPEGAYTFPLPAGCTVVEFSCRVGSARIVRGRVKPKLEAREAFDNAARRNQPAGLLEQDTPEIFTTKLANIPADTKLQAEISFITLLNHRFSEHSAITTLTIPTYIASRYGPAPDFQHDPSAELPQSLSVRIEVLAAEHITSIASKTHNVTVERDVSGNICQSWSEFVTRDGTEDPMTALVELANGSTFLDRDFVLDITTLPQGGFESPHACTEKHPSLENHNVVMITIPPKFMLPNQSPIHDAEVLFIADRSGSMTDKIESLKSAMRFFLNGIPQGKYFNVWCFGSDYSCLWPRSRLYSDITFQEALSHVSQYFRADMGGTELLSALKAIVNARGGYHMTDVIMLTDGEVWKLDETIDFIKNTRRSTEGRVRFFALGIGDAVSHELVEGIAKAGGGYAEVIPAASQGGWEDRVVAVLGAALTGHIGPLKIEYESVDGQIINASSRRNQLLEGSTIPIKPEIMQSPAEISTLSPFLRNRVFILIDSTASLAALNAVHIKIIAPDGDDVDIRIPIKLLTKRDSTIHKLAARALLSDLERGQSWIQLDPRSPSRNSSEEKQLTRTNGESLGCKWSLVSKWTSFYAIEEIYEVQEGVRDPFLNPDDPHIHHIVNNNLDLLRPRGRPSQQLQEPLNAPYTGTGALLGEETGDDEDSSSESDSSELGSDGDNGGDGRGGGGDGGDGGDGGGSGSGSGGSSGLGGGTGGQHEGRDPSRNETHGQARDAADGAGHPYHSPASQERTHNPSLGSIQTPNNTANNLPASEIAYTAPPALSPSEIAARHIASTSHTTVPSPMPVDTRKHKFKSVLSRYAKPSPASQKDEQRNQSTRSSLSSDIESLHTTLSPLKPVPAHPTPSTHTTTSIDAKIPTDTKPLKYTIPLIDLELSDARPLIDTISSTATLPARNDQSWVFKRMENSDMSSDKPSTTHTPIIQPEREIQTPNFNAPASTWTIPARSAALKSAQDTANEAMVNRLVNFQSFAGSFGFDFSLNEANDLFGNSFVQVIETLQTNEALVQYSSTSPAILAATIATIVLLEVRFQSCKDLWTLMVSKARAYVDGHVPKDHREVLYKLAKNQLLLDSRLDLSSNMHEDKQQPLRGFTQADSIVTSLSPPSISNQAAPKSALTSEAQAPTALPRRSFLRDGMKKFRQAKGEPESPTIKNKKEPSARSPFPIRRSWKGIKSFHLLKSEPKSRGLHTEELLPNATPLTAGSPGLSVPSSGKSPNSFASTQRSWVGRKEDTPGDMKVPSTPSLGLVTEGGDLFGRRVALETVPVDLE